MDNKHIVTCVTDIDPSFSSALPYADRIALGEIDNEVLAKLFVRLLWVSCDLEDQLGRSTLAIKRATEIFERESDPRF